MLALPPHLLDEDRERVPLDVAPAGVGGHFSDGAWALEAVESGPEGSYEIHTTSFSVFGLFTVAADVVGDYTGQALSALTGGLYIDPAELECPDGTVLTLDGGAGDDPAVRIDPAGSSVVDRCATTDGETTTVALVNQRRYAVLIDHGSATAIEPSTTDLAAQLSTVLREVFDTVLGTVLAAPIGVVGGTIAYFWSSGAGMVDIINGDASTTLTIEGFDPESIAGHTPDRASGETSDPGATERTGWPIDRNDGSSAFFAYLGASFQLPTWTSCPPDHSIAGLDDEIGVWTVSPVDYLGSFSADTADPFQALVGVGLDADEARILLEAG